MDPSSFPWLLASLLAVAAVSQWARARWLARRPSVRAKARVRRAQRGEREAERLLRRRGYRVVARQPRAGWDVTVDGALQRFEVRPDLLVAGRLGATRVAEIKTGRTAPRVDHPATRRQLLEYALAFGVDGVLLVDVESERIREVTFQRPASRRVAGSRWLWLMAGTCLGAAACGWWLHGA